MQSSAQETIFVSNPEMSQLLQHTKVGIGIICFLDWSLSQLFLIQQACHLIELSLISGKNLKLVKQSKERPGPLSLAFSKQILPKRMTI